MREIAYTDVKGSEIGVSPYNLIASLVGVENVYHKHLQTKENIKMRHTLASKKARLTMLCLLFSRLETKTFLIEFFVLMAKSFFTVNGN